MTATQPHATPSTAELYRLLCNMLRAGIISQVDTAQFRIRVATGGLTTDWIRWVEERAGSTGTWNPPTVGEQVMLLSPGGDLRSAVALRGIPSAERPPPSSSASVHCTRYPDGAQISYDHSSGNLAATGVRTATVQASERYTVDCPEVLFTGAVTISKRLTYQGGLSGSNAGGSAASIQGDIDHSQGSLTSNGITLHTHHHDGTGEPLQ